MTPDDVAGDNPTLPLPLEPGAGAPGSGATEPIVAPHVPVADLSTAPLEPATAAPAGRAPSRLGMWALIGVIAVLGIGVIEFITATAHPFGVSREGGRWVSR